MRNAPEDNLAYPILIKIGTFTGTWFMLKHWEKVFLVTAKHVLFDEKENKFLWWYLELISQTRDISDDSKHKIWIKLDKVSKYIHDTSDVAVIELWKHITNPKDPALLSLSRTAGIEYLEKGNSPLVMVDDSAIKYINDVLIGNDILLYWYPTSLWFWKPQFDYEKPLLRKGIIAGINTSESTIILDCPVYPGNSGGPVVEIEQYTLWNYRFRVIWVVIEFIPYVEQRENKNNKLINKSFLNSWYSIVVSMDKVLELIWSL